MPYIATPITSHLTSPSQYVTHVVTELRTAQHDHFYKAYSEQPPSDYRYRILSHPAALPHITHVFTLDVAADSLEEANDYVRTILMNTLQPNAQCEVTLVSQTHYTTHPTSTPLAPEREANYNG